MRSWREALVLAVAVTLLLLATGASRRAESFRPVADDAEILYLPSAGFLKVASFGFDDVVMDALWFRLIQYYGEGRQGAHALAFFDRLARTVLELDPHFLEGYRFSAIVMAQDLKEPEAGIAILEKGMAVMPNEWWLPFDAGFIEYTTRLDDEAAYRWFHKAAEVPDAPDFPKRFAAFVGGRAGNLEVSRILYKSLAETTSNEHLREDALEKVEQLEAALRGEAPVPEWAKRRRVIDGKSGDGNG